MSYNSEIRTRFVKWFQQNDPPTLVSQNLLKGNMAVAKVVCDTAYRTTRHIPTRDAYFVGLAFRPCPIFDYFTEGRPTITRSVASGDVMVHDLTRNPSADTYGPSGSLFFYFTPKVFAQISDDAEVPRIEALHLAPGASRFDRTLENLGSSLLPAFENPEEASGLFIDHVLYAVSTHIAQCYGGMSVKKIPVKGGLAPWQERRAAEILRANLDGNIDLRTLAQEFGLSTGHFCRSFRKSMGKAPHQWLMQNRVDTAKDLLRDQKLALSDIALACGFADQSHFTRVFSQNMGITPGAWRRCIEK